ncbi:MAG: GspE/PulE family protein [candidate division WOR-3 bacterium]|nr:GspE/PulE family protein [candidate division WOR-3 bacterium]
MKQKRQSRRAGKPAAKPAEAPSNDQEVKQAAPATAEPVVAEPKKSPERWVNELMIRAARDRASDIHIEQTREGLSVRFRIDGVLHAVVAPQKALESAIVSRIKAMSRIGADDVAPDGRYGAIIDGREVDFRVSIFPATYGEAIVMRILDRIRLLPMDQLGFSPPALKRTRDLIARPHGVVLVTGPGGSGTSSTLYAILNALADEKRNIVTIENPVEFDLDRVRQTQVNPRAGYTYPVGLGKVLRQDPDVIMLGGLRDAEVAGAAMGAALTGRLVFSTMHADDAPETVTRLVDMGVEPFLVAKGLEGVIAQRLVRMICPACKHSYEPDTWERVVMGLKPGQKLQKGRGCTECNGTGYKGRIGIFEVLPINDEIRDLVATRPHAKAVRDLAGKAGVATLLEDGLEKVKTGITTIDEVKRVTGKPMK